MVTSPSIRPKPIRASSSSTAKDRAASRPMAPAAPRLPRGSGASGAWTKIGCGACEAYAGSTYAGVARDGRDAALAATAAAPARWESVVSGSRGTGGLQVLRPVVPRASRPWTASASGVGGALGAPVRGRIVRRLGRHSRHRCVIVRGIHGDAVARRLGLGQAAVRAVDHVVRGGRLCDGLADRGLRLRSLGITHRGALLTRGTSPPCESTPGAPRHPGGVPMCRAACRVCRAACRVCRGAPRSPRVGRATDPPVL